MVLHRLSNTGPTKFEYLAHLEYQRLGHDLTIRFDRALLACSAPGTGRGICGEFAPHLGAGGSRQQVRLGQRRNKQVVRSIADQLIQISSVAPNTPRLVEHLILLVAEEPLEIATQQSLGRCQQFIATI
jgi:hypothetical protein